ncbi:MAG: alpha-D-ribose 1-methylphosphonate 5-triphosphate diphosphatase [Alphaproteobacteria bacterium]|nr:alpha-D-ribose 1-methylphosphonate 5-triphosphate diphosphatase [Alphaproteobacteria bacterium]
MATETILSNARIVGPKAVFAGSLAMSNGRIAAVERVASGLASAENLDGDLLLPGLVELHTDNLEHHVTPRPGVIWPAAAALNGHDAQLAAAGITTVLDAISVGEYRRGSIRARMLGMAVAAITAARAADTLRIDHYLHLRLELSDARVVELFEPHADEPLVRLASLMDHTPGQRQWRDMDKYRRFNLSRNNWTEREMDDFIGQRLENQRRHFADNRRVLLAACQARAIPLASHDDTTLDHVEEAAGDGIAIAEFPTTVAAAELAHRRGMAIVMGAPNVVQGGSHSGNASAIELAALGLVDALASDYVPISLLQAPFLLSERIGTPLPEAVAWVSANPARMAGFTDRGEIVPGRRADLVRVREVDGVPVVRAVWRAGRRIV